MKDFLKTIFSAMKTWVRGNIKEISIDYDTKIKNVATNCNTIINEVAENIQTEINNCENRVEDIENDLKDFYPDWNQNDPNSRTYIKNRTHWEENGNIEIIPESTVTVKANSLAKISSNTYPIPTIGQTYMVMFNNEKYYCVARRYNRGALLGNGVIYGDVDIGNNEPFVIEIRSTGIAYLGIRDGGTYTISVVEPYNIIHKLDSKYLPEELTNKMDKTNPSGTGSFSMNRKADTTIGDDSHAEGYETTASGYASHAEGRDTIASGSYSHAKGYSTQASGSSSHAEGDFTTASGSGSHAEGYQTIASGDYSHAEGRGTIATKENSHVEGKYNIPDLNHNLKEYSFNNDRTNYIKLQRKTSLFVSKEYETDGSNFILKDPIEIDAEELYNNKSNYIGYYGSIKVGSYDNTSRTWFLFEQTETNILCQIVSISLTSQNSYMYQFSGTINMWTVTSINKYAHIVGNGTYDGNRSNAHTLDWDGNAWYQGEVYVGGTAQDDENAVKLAKVTDIPEAIEQWMTENPVQAEVPEALPNPNKLTFTGAVTAEYDGSEEVAIEIPEIPEIPESIPIPETAEVGQTIVVKAIDEKGVPTEWECADFPEGGSGGERRLIKEITLTEDTYTIDINSDSEGKPFELTELIVYGYTQGTASAGAFRINCHTNNDNKYSLLALLSFKGLDTTKRYWMAKCEYLGEPGKWMCGLSTPDTTITPMQYLQKGCEGRIYEQGVSDGNGLLTKLSHIRITSNTSGNNLAAGSIIRIYGR